MDRQDRDDITALRLGAVAGSGAAVLVAGLAAVGLYAAFESWGLALLGLLAVAALMGVWVDVRVRRDLELIQKLLAAAGELSESRSPRPIDEAALGRFAPVGTAFNVLIEALAGMAKRVMVNMARVRSAPEQIAGVLEEVQRSADAQEEAVEETASLMANINSSIRLIGERIENLSRAADDSSSSILEMGTSVDEVARNAASLHESFESSSSAVHEMSASIRQVADSAGSVRSMAEESAISMNEMDRSLQEVSGHVKQASTLTATVSQGARYGSEAVAATIEDVERIDSLMSDTRQGLGQLVSRIVEVSQIMNVIGDINDETNLLSLNAAIIAAQAGEQGKAFLVVANHVKTLATRTASSTKDIERLIAAIQAESDSAVSSMEAGSRAIEQGVSRSKAAGDALTEIRRSADEANSTVGEIARAADEQSRNSQLVARAVQETSSQIHQISEAMSEQTKVSERMLETSQKALSMCQHVHRSTDEQRETGRYITSSISSITDMIAQILEGISEHQRASESVSEAVFRLLDNARAGTQRMPELGGMLGDLHRSAGEIVDDLARFQRSDDDSDAPQA